MWFTTNDWKKVYVVKIGPTEKFFLNKKSSGISDRQSNIKNQIMAYRWTFRKDSVKLEKILRAIHN